MTPRIRSAVTLTQYWGSVETFILTLNCQVINSKYIDFSTGIGPEGCSVPVDYIRSDAKETQTTCFAHRYRRLPLSEPRYFVTWRRLWYSLVVSIQFSGSVGESGFCIWREHVPGEMFHLGCHSDKVNCLALYSLCHSTLKRNPSASVR